MRGSLKQQAEHLTCTRLAIYWKKHALQLHSPQPLPPAHHCWYYILAQRSALCERKIPIRRADISFNSSVPLQASRWDLLLLFSQGCAFPCAKASLLVNNSHTVRFIAEIENTHTTRTAETSQVAFAIWFFHGLSGCTSQSDLASCKCNDFEMDWIEIKTICSGRRARKNCS
jgi:hypothetical protein